MLDVEHQEDMHRWRPAVLLLILLGCDNATTQEIDRLGCPIPGSNTGENCGSEPRNGMCAPGYELVGGLCFEINECRRDLNPCHELASCVDGDNEAICYCDSQRGLFGDGTTCVERKVLYGCRCLETCDADVLRDDRDQFCDASGQALAIRQSFGACPPARDRPRECESWNCSCRCYQTSEACS